MVLRRCGRAEMVWRKVRRVLGRLQAVCSLKWELANS